MKLVTPLRAKSCLHTWNGMDNASAADLKQLVEDPEDAPLVEAADGELARGDKPIPPAQGVP
jgi:hypothetical protein